MTEDFLLKLRKVMNANGLTLSNGTIAKGATGLQYVWYAYGKSADHQATIRTLLASTDVEEPRVL